jgi:hypothetical protein
MGSGVIPAKAGIQTFWSETKMDAGLNNSGMTFYDYCNVVELCRNTITCSSVLCGLVGPEK